MKKLVRFMCMILVCSLLFVVPAQAASVVEPRESAFFSSYGTDLYKTSSSSFQVWFDVVANAGKMMQVLGVSEIVVYRSANQQSWTKMRTYTMDNYPEMVDQNTEPWLPLSIPAFLHFVKRADPEKTPVNLWAFQFIPYHPKPKSH